MVSIQLKEKCLVAFLTDLLKDLRMWYPDIPEFSQFYNMIKAFPSLAGNNIYPELSKKLIEFRESILENDLLFFMNIHPDTLIDNVDIHSSFNVQDYYTQFDLIKTVLEREDTTEDIKKVIWNYLEKMLKIVES